VVSDNGMGWAAGSDSKGIQSERICASSLEHVGEENQGEPANPGLYVKLPF